MTPVTLTPAHVWYCPQCRGREIVIGEDLPAAVRCHTCARDYGVMVGPIPGIEAPTERHYR